MLEVKLLNAVEVVLDEVEAKALNAMDGIKLVNVSEKLRGGVLFYRKEEPG